MNQRISNQESRNQAINQSRLPYSELGKRRKQTAAEKFFSSRTGPGGV